MKILFIPFGTKRIAATRYRVYQYLPFLGQNNIKYRVFSIVSDFTTRQMIQSPNFRGTRRSIYYLSVILDKMLRLTVILAMAPWYDILFLQRTTLPFGLERLLKLVNKNIVFDLDDAIFIPDHKEKGIIGRLKEYAKASEVSGILKVSRLAIVENEYINSYAKRYCQDVYLIPGPIDTERNFVKLKIPVKKIVIGWIGSPSTTPYLNMLDNVFINLAAGFDIEVKLVGSGEYDIAGVKIVNQAWAYEREISDLQSFDIGVMPMPDNEWTNGKLGCKMLQYMAVGIPAVVSYTKTNAEVIDDGVNGFLARSDKEWIDKMSRLITDSSLRERIGLEGRNTVEKRFSLKVNAPKLKELLENIL